MLLFLNFRIISSFAAVTIGTLESIYIVTVQVSVFAKDKSLFIGLSVKQRYRSG